MSAEPAGGFVAAIDIGGTKIALATAGLDGAVLEQRRLPTETERGAPQAVRRALDAAADLIERTRARGGGPCLALGAVSPGIAREDRIDLVPTLPGWERLGLAGLLRDGLGLERTVIANDVKAAGAAEARWGSLRGVDPALYIGVGTGLAAAVVVGGRVVTGAHGAAGEVGYSLSGPDGGAGAAEGRAPLEERVSGGAIGRRASRLLGREVCAERAFALAATDARARHLVDEALAELAVHVANWAILLDPGRIAVGGGLMRSADVVLAALRRRVALAVPFPPEVVPARFVEDAALRGAIALALDAL